MRYGKIKTAAFFLLLLYIFSFAASAMGTAAAPTGAVTALADSDGCVEAISEDIRISSRILELFGKDGEDVIRLAVGGGVFGLKIKEKGVSVSSAESGSRFIAGDRILKVNGMAVSSPTDVEKALESSHGLPIQIELVRSGEPIQISVLPKLEGGKYRLGVTLRTLATGIGTVSFIDPDTGLFAGLGHGVCDPSGELITLESGVTTNVILSGVKKGEPGTPGELSGTLTRETTGTLYKNSDCGIFGQFESLDRDSLEILPVARHDEVKTGEAEIISTVKNGRCARYKVELFEIDYSSEGPKSFKIRVTDDTLKAMTGGIVRGMSGSPVIQNGKIVGALTHVMVSDSCLGYGIFIENMLGEMKAK